VKRQPTKRERDQTAARVVVRCARDYVVALAHEALAIKRYGVDHANVAYRSDRVNEELAGLVDAVAALKGGAW
jgi:hypothetical protein